MRDNELDAVKGSALSPRDTRYEPWPQPLDPGTIDGEPHEVAAHALAEYSAVLANLTGYAQRVEDMVRSAMLSEAVTLPDNMLPPAGAGAYPETTYELSATARANQALGMAFELIEQARAELEKPIAESRRML